MRQGAIDLRHWVDVAGGYCTGCVGLHGDGTASVKYEYFFHNFFSFFQNMLY